MRTMFQSPFGINQAKTLDANSPAEENVTNPY